MSRQRFVVLLVAALVVICGAFYLNSKRNPPAPMEGVALLPSLPGDLASLSAVSIKKGATNVTVHRTGEQWTVAERADYPADVTKLRKLLLALRDAKIVERKTSNPTSFAVIGVEDPAQPGASSSEVSVTAPTGTLAVIVGKSTGEGNFVRRAGENQSYSVEPALSFETEPRYWIDAKLFNLANVLIQSEQVKPSEGPAYTVHRAATPLSPPTATAGSVSPPVPAAGDVPFILDGVPAGRKALDASALAPSTSYFSDLTAEDVAQAADVDFKQPAEAVVTLADGTVITLTGTVIADKHWIQIASTKDTALSVKPAGRAFLIASYRYDALFKPLEQLLTPKDLPAPKGALPQSVAPRTPAATFPRSSPARPGPSSSPTP